MATHPPRAGSDPFSPTANPAAYVARTATEAVLVQLEMALDDELPLLLLDGPAGAGKTLLLHVLAQRVDGRFQTVYLPYPKLSPKEFFQWSLAALGERPHGDAEVALRGRIARDALSGFPPLLLMVDDAGSMPAATLRRLLDVQVDYPDALRTLLVSPDPAALQSCDLDLACERVGLEGEMDRPDLGRYVRARLEATSTDADSRQRLESALDQLYRQSAGNPARLHAAAAALLGPRVASYDTHSPQPVTPAAPA